MEQIKCKHVAQLEGGFEMANRVYSPEGLCPTIRTMQGGGLEPKIIEDFYKSREPREFAEVAPTLRSERQGLKVVEGRRFYEQAFETVKENDCDGGDTIDAFNKKVNKSGVSPTVTTRPEGFKTAILVVDEPIVYDGFNQNIRKDTSTVGTITSNVGKDLKRNGQGIVEHTKQFCRSHGFNKGGVIESEVFPTVRRSSSEFANNGIIESSVRVRKLTPKECWRLMGFDDESFHRAKKVVSNSQLYKQAGNSIVVDVLMAIFKNLF